MAEEKKFLTEDQVVELTALFLSCSLLLLREPALYGPLRQLTAAERLAAMVYDDVSPEVRQLLDVALERIPVSHTVTTRRDQYKAIVVELNEALGDCLAARAGLTTGGEA
ncbi:MAG: DUF6092 family protein [Anaerolineaceae bacterium]|nr:DUF6092 family protein [Anaerolineaceae bacterium]MDE0330199.1 DUF6092 family protein [Anaerolineaceae bacterium]